ncbi:37S ribosomal protein s5 [Xylariaceae sp. FL0255]|nr:37S ribosomal protein s5 [Xylariaceae sp. FL0255]
MSVARPAARSLLLSQGRLTYNSTTTATTRIRIAAAVTATAPSQSTCPHAAHPFHTSAPLAKRKPRFKSIHADAMGLTTPEAISEFAQKAHPAYTPEELDILREKYTPEQMAALEAGEASIDPEDLTLQGRLRDDPYKFEYLEDFSKIKPIIDKQPKTKVALPPPKQTFMTEEEDAEDLEQLLRSLVPKDVNFEGMTREQIEQTLLDKVDFASAESKYFLGETSAMRDYKEPTNNAFVPELGNRIAGVYGMYKTPQAAEDQGMDPTGRYQDLKKRTGLTLTQILNVKCKIIAERYVSNQTRLGKIQSIWYMAIAGNENGRLGIGVAKSVDQGVSRRKAMLLAIQNLKPIRRYEDRTIYGSVQAKFGSTIVKLDARPPGFGLRASHRFFEIFRICGIKDIAARMPRGRNPMNSVKACVAALRTQQDPDELAIGRGRKLVDVRKVYYGGNPL